MKNLRKPKENKTKQINNHKQVRIMCADQNRMPGSISSRQENGHNDPIHVAVTIDMNDIYDGALKVLKRIKPFWPINNVQFKVGSKPFKPPHYTFDPPKNLVLCLCVCFFCACLLLLSYAYFTDEYQI